MLTKRSRVTDTAVVLVNGSPWRRRVIRVESALPPDVALDRLRAEVIDQTTFHRRSLETLFSFDAVVRPWRLARNDRPRAVVGRITGHTVAATAQRIGLPHSWAPHVRGQITANANGCELVGTIGWPRQVTVGLLLFIGVLVALVVRGALAGSAGAIAVPVGFTTFVLALTVIGDRLGRKDDTWFRKWLALHLEGHIDEDQSVPSA